MIISTIAVQMNNKPCPLTKGFIRGMKVYLVVSEITWFMRVNGRGQERGALEKVGINWESTNYLETLVT